MPASEPPISVVDQYEHLREFLPDLEDFGAKHEDLDLLNEVLGDSEYQALGEVYDILTMQLPPTEKGSVNGLVQDVLNAINADSRPPKHAREMRSLLADTHLKAFLEAYDDIANKAYVSDSEDADHVVDSEREEERNEDDDDDHDDEDEEEEEEDKIEKRNNNKEEYKRESDREDKRESDREDKRESDREDKPVFGSYHPPSPVYDQTRENHRFVILRKSGQEPLGITVRLDDHDNLFIAKIRQNSLSDKQSFLQVGDRVKEVNGVPVYAPEDLMAVLKEAEEWIIIKIVPQHGSKYLSEMSFMRACITYNSMTDRQIPFKKLGLSFNAGDILAVVVTSDENWWQAYIADDPNGPVGLIPSKSLQEKRQVLVAPETSKAKSSLLCGMGKKKKKVNYDAANAGEYEDGQVKIYEEVMLSDHHRCCVALIGIDNEAKRYLKERLIREFPDKYSATVPETSRAMKAKDKQGRGYIFVDPQDMKEDIRNKMYIEEGEYKNHWYGLRISSILDVVHSGKMCVLDVAPQYLQVLMAPEFRPVVVFIAAPRWESVQARSRQRKGRRINNNRDEFESDDLSEEKVREQDKESRRLHDRFRRNFDEVLVNDDQETTYQNLMAFLQDVTSHGQKWVRKGPATSSETRDL